MITRPGLGIRLQKIFLSFVLIGPCAFCRYDYQTMSSSRPSLIVDTDDDWGEFSALPSSASSRPSPTTSTPSGEFNNFTNVGAVIAAGGIK